VGGAVAGEPEDGRGEEQELRGMWFGVSCSIVQFVSGVANMLSLLAALPVNRGSGSDMGGRGLHSKWCTTTIHGRDNRALRVLFLKLVVTVDLNNRSKGKLRVVFIGVVQGRDSSSHNFPIGCRLN